MCQSIAFIQARKTGHWRKEILRYTSKFSKIKRSWFFCLILVMVKTFLVGWKTVADIKAQKSLIFKNIFNRGKIEFLSVNLKHLLISWNFLINYVDVYYTLILFHNFSKSRYYKTNNIRYSTELISKQQEAAGNNN